MAAAVEPTWSDPVVEEVADDVYRIPLPLPSDGLRAVNVYLIEGGDRPVCVDSGWAVQESREVLVDSLAGLGYEPGDIERFLVTHIHRDHYTQAIDLRREVQSKISLGAGEREGLEILCDPDDQPSRRRWDNLIRNGAGELVTQLDQALLGQPMFTPSVWEMPDDWVLDGDVLEVGSRQLRVVETPGHTRGHVVFHDADSALLFAGDHVLPTITPSIGFEVAQPENPLGDFLDSLARVRALPDALLLPAHGPTATSVHRRVDELVAHHVIRLDQALAAVRHGADTSFEVAKVLRWTRRERTMDELDLFNQMLAVTETGAHLRLLEAQGRVHSVIEDGVTHYLDGEGQM